MKLFNKYQTELTQELIDSLPKEIIDDLYNYIDNVPFIQNLVSPNRQYAKDRPRDSNGRIIVDLINPHILEDMDYFRETAIHFQKYGCFTKLKINKSPQSEYMRWFRREIDRCWNGMIRPEDGEWITGDMYFYLNYFPIIQTIILKDEFGNDMAIGDRKIDFPKMWEGVYLRSHYLYQARYGGLYNDFKGGNHAIEIAARGKAFAYSQFIYTPKGYQKWGDLKIGDEVFTPNGDVAKIIDIPFDDYDDIYKMTLSDGREVYTTSNHLWKLNLNGYNYNKLYTTKELLKVKNLNRYFIEKSNAVEFKEKLVPIDPYFLGLMLGDGSLTISSKNTAQFSSCKEDINTYSKITGLEFKEVKNSKQNWLIKYNNFGDYLKELNLDKCTSINKFIPNIYKYNSKEIRLNILKGLLDTDGSVHDSGKPEFYTISKQLADDVAFICRSLGYNVSISKKKSKFNNIIYNDCYIVYIQTIDPLFNLERKLNKLNTNLSNLSKSRILKTSIKSIEFSHREKAKCITIDKEDGMFLIGDFIKTHNSKSYFIGSKLTKNFLLGNNSKHRVKVKSLVSAYQKEYLIKDGILNKFVDGINFLSKNTQFPGKKIKKSWADLQWVAGWLNKDNDPQGTENEVLGVAVADDVDKMRGKRSDFMGYEEFGMYPRFLEVWQTSLPNVQEGAIAFGQAYAIGTGGSEGSDFFGAYEMIMYPLGYNVYGLPNVYDRGSTGNKRTIFFFPDFINRVGFYNKDGVSDVIGAMIDELKVRYNLKYNSSDPLQLTRRRAEYAFTLQDAIMRRNSTIYPVADLNDRIGEIDNDPDIQNKMWVGRLDIVNGKVEYRPDSDIKTILNFPHKDNNLEGAITIHKMPIYDSNGKIPWGRYIAGADPYDDDHSETLSLFSGIILDLWTDEIVLEYTGRPKFADDAYENWRRCLMFYNAECNYENNKKGLYTYFSKTHSLHLLSDNLDFLKDKENLKINYGNKSKGTGNYSNGKGSIAGYARMLNRNYLLKPVEIITEIDGEEIINSIPQLKLIPYRALLQELAMWNEDINTDRHDALSMLMLLREDKLRLLGDNSFENKAQENDTEYLGNDEFFKKNYKSSRNNGFELHPLLKEMIDKEKK